MVLTCEVILPCPLTFRRGRRMEAGVGFLGICTNHLLLPPSGPLCSPVPPEHSRGLGTGLSSSWVLCEWRRCNRHCSMQGLDKLGALQISQGLKRLKQHRPKSIWGYSAHLFVEPRWNEAFVSPASPPLASAVDPKVIHE